MHFAVPNDDPFDKQKKIIFWGNLLAGIFHWISFTVALVICLVFSDSIYVSQVTLTTLEDVGGGIIGPVTKMLGRYRISGTLLPVPALTGTFHLMVSLVPYVRRMYEGMVFNNSKPGWGYNTFRWIEYSISASLVTWNIAQVSGICDIFTLLSLIGLNVMMQMAGGLGHEMHNRGKIITIAASKNSKNRHNVVDWYPYLLGFVPFVLTWGFILPAFVLAVLSSTKTVPWFVWSIVIGLLAQYSMFAVPVLIHYNGFWPLKENYRYEIAYIVLSFVSKAWLDWILIIGSITR